MSVPHFFVEPDDVHDGVVSLAGAEAHHAAHVLRVRPGELISVADGSGRVLDAVITSVGKTVEAEVGAVHHERAPNPSIVLVQGVAKGERMDAVVQKSVEVGVRRVTPVMSERTVQRWDDGRRAKAVRRWREIARGAAKQCRSPWITAVDDVRDVIDDVDITKPTIVLHIDVVVRLRDALPPDVPEVLGLVVGPEGGLSRRELSVLADRGATTATLGPRVLRTETAGPIAAALILYAYGSLG